MRGHLRASMLRPVASADASHDVIASASTHESEGPPGALKKTIPFDALRKEEFVTNTRLEAANVRWRKNGAPAMPPAGCGFGTKNSFGFLLTRAYKNRSAAGAIAP